MEWVRKEEEHKERIEVWIAMLSLWRMASMFLGGLGVSNLKEYWLCNVIFIYSSKLQEVSKIIMCWHKNQISWSWAILLPLREDSLSLKKKQQLQTLQFQH